MSMSCAFIFSFQREGREITAPVPTARERSCRPPTGANTAPPPPPAPAPPLPPRARPAARAHRRCLRTPPPPSGRRHAPSRQRRSRDFYRTGGPGKPGFRCVPRVLPGDGRPCAGLERAGVASGWGAMVCRQAVRYQARLKQPLEEIELKPSSLNNRQSLANALAAPASDRDHVPLQVRLLRPVSACAMPMPA